ncbi:hypothetical protein Tco_0006963 [Tanacetum coccineum]
MPCGPNTSQKSTVLMGVFQSLVGQLEGMDGRSTKFWLDNWIGDQAFCTQFPRLFRLEEKKACLVRDRWNDGWTWSWSRPIGEGITSTHFSNLLNRIENVQLIDGNDEWI